MNCDYIPEIWPGPMEGIGKAAFVRAVNSLRLTERWMTPFLRLSQEMPKRSKLETFISPFTESGSPVTVQLMGTDAGLLGECAAVFMELGAAGININFGCPSKRVTSGGAGGGALRKPDKLADFCTRVKSGAGKSTPLSVKLRAGWDDPEDMRTVLPQLANCGAVDKIFFHYRTVGELYGPLPEEERLRRFSLAAELCKPLPLIINGDFATAEDTLRILKNIPVHGVMIARPWMRDPFLLRRFCGDDTPAGEGREIFLSQLQKLGVSGGALLELVRMLWGVNDPHFKKLLIKQKN